MASDLSTGLSVFLAPVLRGGAGLALAAVWGALWGSFFNVVIVRVPAGESLVRPGSHCGACGVPIRWFDNIPLVSYIVLRGRCRACRAPFSIRYWFVELLVMGLAVALQRTHLSTVSAELLPLALGQFVITSLFAGLLVAIAFIDCDTLHIPNAITYPGIPVAVVLSVFMELPHLWDGAIGAAGGYLLIRAIADGYELITRRQGMGYGDAKLLAMIGGLLGWQMLLPTLLFASFQGSVIGISALVIARRAGKRLAASTPTAPPDASPGSAPAEASSASNMDPSRLRYARIPFGPFLGLAAIELMLLRPYLPVLFP